MRFGSGAEKHSSHSIVLILEWEGAWIGALGAIIPSVLIYVLYHMVYSTLNPDFVKGGISMYDADWFVYAVIGTLFAVGIIIGSIGSRMAMRRYLKY